MSEDYANQVRRSIEEALGARCEGIVEDAGSIKESESSDLNKVIEEESGEADSEADSPEA